MLNVRFEERHPCPGILRLRSVQPPSGINWRGSATNLQPLLKNRNPPQTQGTFKLQSKSITVQQRVRQQEQQAEQRQPGQLQQA